MAWIVLLHKRRKRKYGFDLNTLFIMKWLTLGKEHKYRKKKWRNDEYLIFHLWNHQNKTGWRFNWIFFILGFSGYYYYYILFIYILFNFEKDFKKYGLRLFLQFKMVNKLKCFELIDKYYLNYDLFLLSI